MHIQAKLGQENLLTMVRWLRWHCPPDTGFEIRALAVWGRARYLSVTEAPHNTDFHTWMGKKHFFFFQTTETGNRTPNSGVKGSGANHYPRAPAQINRYNCKAVNVSILVLVCYGHFIIKSELTFRMCLKWFHLKNNLFRNVGFYFLVFCHINVENFKL